MLGASLPALKQKALTLRHHHPAHTKRNEVSVGAGGEFARTQTKPLTLRQHHPAQNKEKEKGGRGLAQNYESCVFGLS